jgi:large subunit ribosomal protein L31
VATELLQIPRRQRDRISSRDVLAEAVLADPSDGSITLRDHSVARQIDLFDRVVSARGGRLRLRRRRRFVISAPVFEGGAMKEGIHPDYHEITVMMTDGSSYKTRSTYGKAGDTLRLDIDPKSHPAWTGGQQRLIDSGGQLARFNKRFQGFGIKS